MSIGHARSHSHLSYGKNKKQDPFNYVVYFFMIATPLFELPQVYMIYSTKDAAGVSVWTWAFFLAASVVWFFYALRRRLMPMMITYSLYFIIELAIVAGIVMYQ